MYNMDITIFGYKLNLEVLILIGVVYLILVGHLFCGCCNMNRIMESFSNNKDADKKVKAKTNLPSQNAAGSAAGVPVTPSVSTQAKEGFTGANINYGESSTYSLTDNTPVDTSAWNQPNMNVVPGQPLSEAVKKFLAREPQQVPLPEGEMLMFANTKFAPEFCPNTYSNSSGCAAMTGAQYNYLITRGGNNVPYSEY
jgi:hypothetical protein